MNQKNPDLVWTWEPLYDTFLISERSLGKSNNIPITLFQVPLGCVGSGFYGAKTESETNLHQPCQLETPNQFVLFGFSAAVSELTGKEDKDAIRQGVFKFILGNLILLELPMTLIPINPSEKSEFFDNKGGMKDERIEEIPYKTGFYYLCPDGNSLLLEWQQRFKVEIKYPEGIVPLPSGKDCRFSIFLVGLHGRYR